MPNYSGCAYSSYFAVENPEEFERLCTKYNLKTEKSQSYEGMKQVDTYRIVVPKPGGDLYYYPAEHKNPPVDSDHDPIYIPTLIAPYLKEGWFAIFAEVGHEECSNMYANAMLVNKLGEVQLISFGDLLFKFVRPLERQGKHITRLD
jgi:hypothetical protein